MFVSRENSGDSVLAALIAVAIVTFIEQNVCDPELPYTRSQLLAACREGAVWIGMGSDVLDVFTIEAFASSYEQQSLLLKNEHAQDSQA